MNPSAGRIFKYTLDPSLRTGSAVVTMPTGSRVLAVHEQRGAICVWVVAGDGPEAPREFAVVGTGDYEPDGGTYVGTVHLQGGAFVFHVFEEPGR